MMLTAVVVAAGSSTERYLPGVWSPKSVASSFGKPHSSRILRLFMIFSKNPPDPGSTSVNGRASLTLATTHDLPQDLSYHT